MAIDPEWQKRASRGAQYIRGDADQDSATASDPNEGNPFEPPESDNQRARRVGEQIRAAASRSAAALLVGKRVNFAHQHGGTAYIVTSYRVSSTGDGMVTLDTLPGEFALHLFVESPPTDAGADTPK